MRVFAALPLPGPARDALQGALEPLRGEYPRLRWVPPDGLHVTLHFFGEAPEPGVAALKTALDQLRFPPIQGRLGPLGQFPPRGQPRVLWMGFDAGSEAMARLWGLFESLVAPLGWPSDPRGFTPHVTVARNNGVRMDESWSGVSVPALDFVMRECILFQSILERGGSRYVPLHRIPLKGDAT